MAWTDVRDQLVTIVEGTDVTTKKRGLPPTFRHYDEARPEDGPDSRAFWFTIKKMGMKGNLTSLLPRWYRYEIDLIVAYRIDDADPTAFYESIALDHHALSSTLPDASLWGQSSSTIESLWLGRDLIMDADLEHVDGAVLVAYHLTVEFRET